MQSQVQTGTTLFSKVSVLLTGAMCLGAAGAHIGMSLTSGGLVLLLSIAWLVSTFGVGMLCAYAKKGAVDATVAMVAAALWTALSGIVVGPAINMYLVVLGPQTVAMAFLGTAGVMASCGAFGMLSGVNFSRLGGILGIAIWGLIIFGIVTIFVHMSPLVDMGYCLIGMAVFAGFFLVDFSRVRQESSDNDWPTAIMLAMSLYLDFLNFFLYLLRFLADLKGRDR